MAEKSSLIKIEAIKLGTFKPTQYNKRKTGYFYSNKNNKDLWYNSSYELLAYQLLEVMINVKLYKVQFVSVPYVFNNLNHNYVIDLYVEYESGQKQLIEVKSSWQLTDRQTIAKLEAAGRYAKESNIEFVLWTEKELGLIKGGVVCPGKSQTPQIRGF